VVVVAEHIQPTVQAYQVVLVAVAVINMLMAELVHKHQAQVDQLVMDFQAEEAVQLGPGPAVAVLAEQAVVLVESCVIKTHEKVT
jgi:hypothetical protein